MAGLETQGRRVLRERFLPAAGDRERSREAKVSLSEVWTQANHLSILLRGMVGLPATAIPLGLSPEGLPVGAQIVGPVFGDPDCLRFAQWIESEYRAFVPPPALAGTQR